jgi:serpin B
MATYKVTLAGLLIMAVTGCSFGGNPARRGASRPTDSNLPPDAQLVANGNNCFALQLYQRLRGDKGNLFFSPYSISTALAMTYAGARGQTQEQMATALCFPTSAEALQKLGAGNQPMSQGQFAQAFGRIIKDLNARGDQSKYELRVANALWGQKGYEFLPAFIQLVETQYDGKLQILDFVAATEKARQTINAWVEKQTNGKIKDLISPGVLDAMTRLVLTNAVYFKGNWASQFKKDQTKDGPFTLLDGSNVQVPMMNQQAEFGYAEIDTFQVLEMPYVGQELSMVILLPKEAGGIGALEKGLTADSLSNWLSRIQKREVIVSVPKFRMTQKLDMGGVLQAMGMTNAFSQAADFSGMTGNRELFISAVIHQAYVDVNEEGTEAAAATGVIMKLTMIGPGQTPIFLADHPFIFLIRDHRSGSILFLGRTMNPNG